MNLIHYLRYKLSQFVRKMQIRIAKAVRENKWNKVKKLYYYIMKLCFFNKVFKITYSNSLFIKL